MAQLRELSLADPRGIGKRSVGTDVHIGKRMCYSNRQGGGAEMILNHVTEGPCLEDVGLFSNVKKREAQLRASIPNAIATFAHTLHV